MQTMKQDFNLFEDELNGMPSFAEFDELCEKFNWFYFKNGEKRYVSPQDAFEALAHRFGRFWG